MGRGPEGDDESRKWRKEDKREVKHGEQEHERWLITHGSHRVKSARFFVLQKENGGEERNIFGLIITSEAWRLQREGNVKRHPDITTVQNIWLTASAGLISDENYREYNSLFPTFYKYIRQGRGNLLPDQKPLQKVILYFITLYPIWCSKKVQMY